MTETISTGEAVEKLKAAGVDVAAVIRGNTYADSSTVALVPTRGMIPHRVVANWLALARPMNSKFSIYFVEGHEVGIAYNQGINTILNDPVLGKFKYLLTLEEDNLVPMMTIPLLIDAINTGGFDAVAGLYHMKSPIQVSLAFGREGARESDGRIAFQPVDLTDDILNNRIVPVNGIPMGCTLWKMDVFRDMPAPWFKTQTRMISGTAVELATQDLNFCAAAQEKGKRFAVDCRVRVGHLDVTTGEVY